MLENKVAIVTGASRGIGYAIAKRFVEEGCKVVIADIEDSDGEAVEQELNEIGSAKYINCDVGSRIEVRNMVVSTVNTFGDIDILVNNAGIKHKCDFLEIEEEDFDKVLNTNLKGAFLCGQVVARHMVNQVNEGKEPGSIINISSINAVYGLPQYCSYSISKGGLNQLTKVMAISLAPYKIRTNAIGPGSINTELFANTVTDPKSREKVLSRTPLMRFGEPKEIASIAVFLASEESNYITGQTIYADGGRMGLNYTVEVKSEEDPEI